MKNFNGSYDHRLETLEGRSLLSAAPDMGLSAATHERVVIADTSFLNAASDAATENAAPNDADMYDFGGAFGTQALGNEVRVDAEINDGAIDQEPGGSTRPVALAAVSHEMPRIYGRAAEYQGGEVIITSNTDPIAADSPGAEADEPAPIVTTTVEQSPAAVAAPIAMPVSAPSDSSIVWLELPGAEKTIGGVLVTESVVISGSFLN